MTSLTSVGQAASFLDAVLASRARSLTVSRESPSDEAAVDVHLEAFSSASTTSLLKRVPSCIPSMTCQERLQLIHSVFRASMWKELTGLWYPAQEMNVVVNADPVDGMQKYKKKRVKQNRDLPAEVHWASCHWL